MASSAGLRTAHRKSAASYGSFPLPEDGVPATPSYSRSSSPHASRGRRPTEPEGEDKRRRRADPSATRYRDARSKSRTSSDSEAPREERTPKAARRRDLVVKFLIMAGLFVVSASAVVTFYFQLPGLSESSREELLGFLPSSLSEGSKLRRIENVRGIFHVFAQYKEEHPAATLLFLSSCYLLYQAFPLFMITFTGTSTLVTILLGAMFSPLVAFSTANVLAAIGPSLAFFMFRWVGKPIVLFLFPEKLRKLQMVLHPGAHSRIHSGNLREAITGLEKATGGRPRSFDVDLFLTVLFLRVSPVFPNLFINAAAPLLEVPFDVFFAATLFGLMPNTILFVSMGSALTSLDSLNSSWKLWLLLCAMAGAVILLKVMRTRLRPKDAKAVKEAELNTPKQEQPAEVFSPAETPATTTKTRHSSRKYI
ncbi:SNARE associated Golgi protein [Toxoplasma gondii GT1]|uniref:SNARE associated Golgi protein n=2 Tax=Toxoplasma gondii TaxID=5811 RepID=S7UGL9_TOXGG|nr:SNARE associated Golgi protein [Toxoplasma gondii GT1]KAF4644018.1 SNARE associated Golgi protein [Toxoplasma gondii]